MLGLLLGGAPCTHFQAGAVGSESTLHECKGPNIDSSTIDAAPNIDSTSRSWIEHRRSDFRVHFQHTFSGTDGTRCTDCTHFRAHSPHSASIPLCWTEHRPTFSTHCIDCASIFRVRLHPLHPFSATFSHFQQPGIFGVHSAGADCTHFQSPDPSKSVEDHGLSAQRVWK